MRCKACNVELSDIESTLKDDNGEYIDLCGHCYNISFNAMGDFDTDVNLNDDIQKYQIDED